MAKLSFDDIRNKESGKVGIVCGTGGSLKEYHKEFEMLSKSDKDKYCFISCNEWNQKTNIDVDYWVIANSVFTVWKEFRLFNSKPNTTLVYASSADLTDKNFVEKNLSINYLPYDERHFNSMPCGVGTCCSLIEPGTKTIQEYLQFITEYEKMYSSCGTVGIHMIALAVILGCNPIYVSGIDMNYATGYVDDSSLKDVFGNVSDFSEEFGRQAQIISDSSKKIGVEIINLSKLSTYGGLNKGEFKMKDRKILVALIHPEEWNQYIPFNGYLSSIRDQYDYVIGVVAEKPLILLSEVDEYYTLDNGYSELSYPRVLDTSVRENHEFIDKCVSKIQSDFEGCNLSYVSWQRTSVFPGIVDIKGDAAKVYRTSFKCAQDWYKKEKLICPTEETFHKVKDEFGHLFNDNTFILLSRNFQMKAPEHNTKNSIINFESMVRFLTENGIKIINIGFPPSDCQIFNENYVEISGTYSQDELISMFYLSKGVLSQADAGGFVSHLSSNSDFFTLTDQWSLTGEFENFDLVSHRTKEVDTINLQQYLKLPTNLSNEDNFEEILKILKDYVPKRKMIFQKSKKITFV